jgi:hypothetical protein
VLLVDRGYEGSVLGFENRLLHLALTFFSKTIKNTKNANPWIVVVQQNK